VQIFGVSIFQYDNECCFLSDIVTGTSESEQASNEINCITLGYSLFCVTDAAILITLKCFHCTNRTFEL